MTDPILAQAYARRDAALREANEWETFIQQYRQLAEASPEARPSATQPQQPRQGPAEREIPGDSELGKTISLVEEILNERGRPVPLANLYGEVTRRGLTIGGKEPRGNLGARLYNSGRFRSIAKRTGWWFKDRPLPDGIDEFEAETPNSATLFGAPKLNGAVPSSP